MDFRSEAKEFFMDAYYRAVEEASPEISIKKYLHFDGEKIVFGEDGILLKDIDRIWVVGFGKASATMASVVEEIFGDIIHEGIVVTKYQHAIPLSSIQVFEASHPIPDLAGVQATNRIIKMLNKTSTNDLVVMLISGGGSALLVSPRPGIKLEDKQAITSLLLRKGVPIEKMNIIRKHLSAVKGGQLACLAFPARIFSLIISDVIDDKLEAIASGATTPDPSSFQDAKAIFDDYDIWGELSDDFKTWFMGQMSTAMAETPKPGDPQFRKVTNMIIANNQKALVAVQRLAVERGFTPLILSSSVQGEAKEIARFYGAIAKEIRSRSQPVSPPACIIAGGETVVNVFGTGKGGRNTEMVLASLVDLEHQGDVAFFSVGTDGTDGPTDAAGAFGFSDSLQRGNLLGLHQKEFLKNNDSYTYFDKLQDLFSPGASGTNVIDLQILLVR